VNGVTHGTSRYEDSTGLARHMEARGVDGAAHIRAQERNIDGSIRSEEQLHGVAGAEDFNQRWEEARQRADPSGRILPADGGVGRLPAQEQKKIGE